MFRAAALASFAVLRSSPPRLQAAPAWPCPAARRRSDRPSEGFANRSPVLARTRKTEAKKGDARSTKRKRLKDDKATGR